MREIEYSHEIFEDIASLFCLIFFEFLRRNGHLGNIYFHKNKL